MPPILARFPPYTFRQVTSTLNLTVSPPASWMYSKWPLTLPSAYLSASNASGFGTRAGATPVVAVFAPTALCLERALPVLERPEPGLLAISRRGGADVPPENAREVALVGEARAGRDLGQRRFASGELGRRPGQPQPASVLPHRQPVVSAKRARQVRGMDTDPLGQLAETDPIREPSPQQLLRGAKPGRRPGVRALDPSLPRGRGEQLEREPLGRERRRR